MATNYNVFLVTYDLEGATSKQYTDLENRIRANSNNCANVCKNVFILSSKQTSGQIYDSVKQKLPKENDILIVTENTSIFKKNINDRSNYKKVFQDAEWKNIRWFYVFNTGYEPRTPFYSPYSRHKNAPTQR